MPTYTLTTLLIVFLLSAGITSAEPQKLSLDLQDQLALLNSETPPALAVIVTLHDGVNFDNFRGGRSTAPTLVRNLRNTAADSQSQLLHWLDGRQGVSDVRPFWIVNSIALKATAEVIETLAQRSDVATIDWDVPVVLPPLSTIDQNENRTPVWSVQLVGAPDVWEAYDLTGEGMIVGSMDTGADLTHPALAGKWRGGSNSWIDIINGQPQPYDDHGHGTHTIGTMVGGDGFGPFETDIGVAPDAQFIVAKVLDQNNSFSSASIVIAGAQFMLDPDGNPGTNDFPHVINNSWLFFSQTYTGFYNTAQAWRAAGIIPVFAIGNNGPNSSTTGPPGNYSNVIGVAATTSSDAIWHFSSRGPSPVGWTFPADGTKPDLAAPGASVYSCLPGGGYQSWSGTSMAAPHVAGIAALMLQGKPDLSYDEIRTLLLETSVDLGPAGYDFDFGHGRLDALAVMDRVMISDVPGSMVRKGPVLLPCRPNPFNPSTTLSFVLEEDTLVRLEVFDMRGRRVARVLDEIMPRGEHEVQWAGRGSDGRELPSGRYLGQLRTASGTARTALTLVK